MSTHPVGLPESDDAPEFEAEWDADRYYDAKYGDL